MEDLWKVREQDFQLGDLAEQAEYHRLVKGFHADEEKSNRKNLLFQQASFHRPQAPKVKFK